MHNPSDAGCLQQTLSCLHQGRHKEQNSEWFEQAQHLCHLKEIVSYRDHLPRLQDTKLFTRNCSNIAEKLLLIFAIVLRISFLEVSSDTSTLALPSTQTMTVLKCMCNPHSRRRCSLYPYHHPVHQIWASIRQ